jgi:rapamycin-insensitive companion of mTOR
MFFDLLNIKTPEWFQTFIDGRRLTSESMSVINASTIDETLQVYRRSRMPAESRKDTHPSERPYETLKLTDQYIALLVLVFTNAGLLDVSIFCVLHGVPQLMILSGAHCHARGRNDWLELVPQGHLANG